MSHTVYLLVIIFREEEELRARFLQLQYAYELRMLLDGDKAREEQERLAMAREEIISSVPPLTKPNPVRYDACMFYGCCCCCCCCCHYQPAGVKGIFVIVGRAV